MDAIRMRYALNCIEHHWAICEQIAYALRAEHFFLPLWKWSLFRSAAELKEGAHPIGSSKSSQMQTLNQTGSDRSGVSYWKYVEICYDKYGFYMVSIWFLYGFLMFPVNISGYFNHWGLSHWDTLGYFGILWARSHSLPHVSCSFVAIHHFKPNPYHGGFTWILAWEHQNVLYYAICSNNM